jgi:phosphoribosylformylglycinamidine synthase
LQPRDHIVVLGDVRPELGGSEWAAWHGLDGGLAPAADLETARRVHDVVADLVRDRSVRGVHDVSDGGLAVAVAEMAIDGGVGFRVDLAVPGCTPAEACFSESASVVVVAVDPERSAEVSGRAAAAGVTARTVGEATGERLIAVDAFDVPLADAARAYRDALPTLMSSSVDA